MSQSFVEDLRDHQSLGAHDIPSTSGPTCKKINDSVYELYLPSAASMDILFFHGLQLDEHSDVHKSTWRARCTGAPIWPQEWIPEDYPDTRVLTVSYDGRIRKSDRDGRMDLYLVVESVLQDLLNAGVGQFGPVILVGHSFGGLVIKRLCLFLAGRTDVRSLAFLQQIRGIFYFATPHQGGFTDIIEKVNTEEGELVKFVKVLNENLARINHEFQNLCNEHKLWHIAGLGETLVTDLGGGSSSIIVEEGSARCGNNFVCVKEDHFSICQPRGKASSTYQYFADFIHDVQHEILSTVLTKFEDLEGDRQIVPPTPVGLLETWEGGEVGQRLASCSAIGLWGMGGIGKTTLAKAIFNRKRSNFEFTLFVEDVKSMPGTNSIEFVEKLLERVHQRGKKVEKISGKSILKGKDLLVVLDDVDSKDDLDDRDIRLVHELRDLCSPNSRFILTSRNSQILNRVHGISIVELSSLDDSSSERLFRSYAIPYSNDEVTLPGWQQECLFSIVKHCGGLPLVLEVVGQYLKTSGERAVWEETRRALVETDTINVVGVDVVRSKLKVSYDNLGEEEKMMFIDAATFFQGRISRNSNLWPSHQRHWSLRDAKTAWRKYGREAQRWKTLVDRSLVSNVADDSYIKMHEHLAHLGQWLAMTERIQVEGSDRISLLDALQERKHQLQEIHTIQLLSDTTTELRGVSCMTCRLKRKITRGDELCPHHFPSINIMGLQEMKNLQYLQLDNCTFAQRKVILPANLVIFRCVNTGKNISFSACTKLMILWLVDFGYKHLPNSLYSLENLQIFHLEAWDVKVLPERFGNMGSLHQLTFRCCNSLERLPTSFGCLPNLQVLEIHKCKRLVGLPDSFGLLGNLQMLAIGYCSELVGLPDSFGGLESLQVLKIYGCTRLAGLPDSFGGLKNLQVLKIKSCTRLAGLPDSFGGLENLHLLEIIYCTRLEELPDSFGGLKNLQVLRISWSERLVRLPDSFGGLRNLQVLETSGCESLAWLPNSFGGLKNLQMLGIAGCERLVELPYSFGGLKNLQVLEIARCERLVELPYSYGGLKNLPVLEIHSCWRFVGLPDSFCVLRNLQRLEIRDCSELEGLPDSFGGLESLQVFRIISCTSLVRLPDSFGGLESLQEFEIYACQSLVGLPDSFGGLKNLQVLKVSYCMRLEGLPDSFCLLRNLQRLKILDCYALVRLPDSFGGLRNLHDLEFKRCGTLQRLPDSFGFLENLRQLLIDDCFRLEALPESFGDLRNLRQLDITRCGSLERLPDSFGEMENLQKLTLWECEGLKTLPYSCGGLQNLQELEIVGCTQLENLPWSANRLKSLSELTIENCGQLQ